MFSCFIIAVPALASRTLPPSTSTLIVIYRYYLPTSGLPHALNLVGSSQSGLWNEAEHA